MDQIVSFHIIRKYLAFLCSLKVSLNKHSTKPPAPEWLALILKQDLVRLLHNSSPSQTLQLIKCRLIKTEPHTPDKRVFNVFVHQQWRSWLRHCATSMEVAGSIADGVIGIFHSGRTVAVGSTQPLKEMSTRDISWGVKAAQRPHIFRNQLRRHTVFPIHVPPP